MFSYLNKNILQAKMSNVCYHETKREVTSVTRVHCSIAVKHFIYLTITQLLLGFI